MPTAIAPTAASDVVGQDHKIGGITFEAAHCFTDIVLNNQNSALDYNTTLESPGH